MNTKLSLLGLAALTFAVGAQAQSDRKGTAGADHLLIPVTAKTTSMGVGMTAGMANMSAVEALQSNPAGLAINTSTDVLFSRMNYVADVGVNYVGIAQRFGQNNIALSLQSWDFGDIAVQSEDSPDVDPSLTYNANYFVAGLSFARQLTDRIAAGTTVKVLSEQIDDMNAGGIALDAGMTYTVGESGLRFGVSLKNFGAQMNYGGNGLVRLEQITGQDNNTTPNAVAVQGANFELPSLLNFGITYTRPLGANANVTTLATFRSNSFENQQFSGGLEIGFANLVYARGGYMAQADQADNFFTGVSAGAGVNLNLGGTAVMVDYAVRPVRYFSGTVQMVTASVRL